jgi:uncharacterized repeat protein (TIGR01451 family)
MSPYCHRQQATSSPLARALYPPLPLRPLLASTSCNRIQKSLHANKQLQYISWIAALFIAAILFIGTPQHLLAAGTLNVNPSNCGVGSGNYCTIQSAIDASSAGDTIAIVPGIYAENVQLNKSVSLVGNVTAMGTSCGVGNPAADTIIRPTSGNLLHLTASGTASNDKLLISNLRLEPQADTGTQAGIYVNSDVDNIKLDGVRIVGDAPFSTVQTGLLVRREASIMNWEITNSFFSCLYVGMWFDLSNVASAGTVADNIAILNSLFVENGIKGLYAEKLSNALIQGNQFIENNNYIDQGILGAANGAGLDINLKFGNYSNISILNNIFAGNGLATRDGGALLIKARDDGATYGALPATLVAVNVMSNTIVSNERGIRLGEPNQANAGPTQVTITKNTIVGNVKIYTDTNGSTYGGIIDLTASPTISVTRNALFGNTDWNIAEANGGNLDATCNWYGTPTGPTTTVSTTTPISLWLTSGDLASPCALYTVAASASTTLGGSVTGTGDFNHGLGVTLVATPTANYTFVNWTEATTPVSADATYNFIATSNRTLVANFAPITYALTVTKSGTGSGTVSSIPAGIDCGATCVITYTHGTTVTLNATPADSSIFTGWSGACSGTAACVVTMDQAKSVEANFTLKSYELAVNTTGTGSGNVTSIPTGIGCGNTCVVTYTHGTTVTLLAVPTEGSIFSGWEGTCASTGTCLVSIDSAKTITAVFDLETTPVAAINLVKTVGVVSGVCAANSTLAVLPGETVYYCYTITNMGNITLTEHTLVDTQLGTLIDGLDAAILPGQSLSTLDLGVEISDTIQVDTSATGTWTALATTEALSTTATAIATVTVGIENYEVRVEGSYTPPAQRSTVGGEMSYNIHILNTGTTPLQNLQVAFAVPTGTTFAASADAWSCAGGAPVGTLCTYNVDLLEPGEEIDLPLTLNIVAEIDLEHLALDLTTESEGTPTSPPLRKQIIVYGPDAIVRTAIFLPKLDR